MRLISRIIITLACLLTAGWIALTTLLPLYLQKSLLPAFAEKAGIEEFHVHDIHIGLFGSSAGFYLGPADSPVLTVSSLAARYTPGSLINGSIRQIAVSGVELNLALINNRPVVEDSSLQKLLTASAAPDKENKKSIEPRLPFKAESLTVSQSVLKCRVADRVYRLPFAAELREQPTGKSAQLNMSLCLFPRGQQIKLTGLFTGTTNPVSLSLNATRLNPDRFADIIKLPQGLDLHGLLDLSAHLDLNRESLAIADFQAALTIHKPIINYNGLCLALKNGKGAAGLLPLRLTVTGKKRETTATWDFKAAGETSRLFAVFQKSRISCPSFKLALEGEFSADRAMVNLHHTCSLAMNDDLIQADIPAIEFNSMLNRDKLKQITMEGTLAVNHAVIHHHPSGMAAQKIDLNLPVSWPLIEQTTPGEFTCGAIKYKGTDFGAVSGKIRLNEKSIKISGSFFSPLFSGLGGSAGLVHSFASGSTIIKLEIPACQLTDVDPLSLTGTKHLHLSGTVTGNAVMEFGRNSPPTGKASLSLAGASLDVPEQGLTVSGIDAGVTLPCLPELRSIPAQEISFKSLTLHDLVITNGDFDFSLESPGSFFLEQGSFSWADGSIHTSSLRFSKEQPVKKLNFYCYNLKLATILQQIGIENVSGKGTLNGRLPITIIGNKVIFPESFLYSIPGQGGHVSIAATDYLTRAIPLDTPQYAQLDFAQEALRDFDYKWAKLHLMTEDKNLVLQLQLDGQPTHPLLFGYNTSTGTFFRRQHGQEGISSPIRLDVNFRFPLNTFLEYDKNIKKILQ